MRLATPLAVLALIGGLMVGCGGSSEGTGSTSPPTGPPTAPAGASAQVCPLAIGGTKGLRATGVSCGEAQRLAVTWMRSTGCEPKPGASHSACTVRGYRCIGTATDRGLSVSCARPGRSVAFTARRG